VTWQTVILPMSHPASLTRAALLCVALLPGSFNLFAQGSAAPSVAQASPAAPVPAAGLASVLGQAAAGRVGGLGFEALAGGPRSLDHTAKAPLELVRFPEGRLAAEVAFLHTFEPGVGIADWQAATGLAHRKVELPPEWPEAFRYELEYADGVKVEIPVRFGESIQDWRRVQTIAPMLWAREHVAQELEPKSGEKAVVYAMRFPNPRPAQPLRALRALPPAQAHRQPGRAWIAGVATAAPVAAAAASGRVLVVDLPPIGDDAQEGSFEKPFGGLARAVAVAKPGDTILVRGGLYVLDRPVVLNFTGEKDRWLTVSAFPGETPILDGYGVHYDYRVEPYVEGGGRAAVGRHQHDTGVIHAMGEPSFLRIQGLQVRNSRRAAISAYGKPEAGSDDGKGWGVTKNVQILFNTTYRSYSMGIITHVIDDLAVIGNRVVRPHSVSMVTDHVTGEVASHDHLPQEGIDISRNRGFEVAFNVVAGGGKEAIDAISVENGTIHHNYVHSSLNGIYIDSWSVPIRGLKIHRNFIHNAFSGIPLATEGGNDLVDFEIHHNLILDSKSEGINVSEATYKAKPARVQNHRVFNNTIHGSGAHALAIGWQGTGISVAGFKDNPNFRDILVAENIVTQTHGRPLRNGYFADAAARGVLFTHNLVYPEGDTTPEWIRARSRDGWDGQNVVGEKALVVDPLYRDPARGDFRLQPGSPALTAARDGGALGAFSATDAWVPGLDWAGAVTAYYHGPVVWTPVDIPTAKFNLFRNHLQRPSWFQRNRYGVDFQNLPEGEQAFAGVTFHVAPDSGSTPNVISVRGHSADVSAEEVLGIPVGRAAARLAFLHNYHLADAKGTKPGATLFTYRVRYADGSAVELPVRLGREVDDWLGRSEADLADLPGARLAWSQPVLKRKGAQQIRLYAMEWVNPRPDVAIESIDLLNAQPFLVGAPALFAISTGAK
jgi:hypothetical protein